ncbi:MAG TPA: hypothetical protein VMU71_03025 [Terracidiphilus sp.]|nr:hypothetical protein [Terracidiphilus sp.]
MLNAAFILAGLIALPVAIGGKIFYSSNVEAGDMSGDKPVPNWSGRLLLGVVGVGLIFIGIMKLLGH